MYTTKLNIDWNQSQRLSFCNEMVAVPIRRFNSILMTKSCTENYANDENIFLIFMEKK